jgi:glycine/serine hydroxymethyltransferase
MKGDRRNGPEKLYSLLRAPGVAAEAVPPWRQSKVRLGCPIKLSVGVKHQEMKTISEPVARTIPRFMHLGARRA